MKLIKKTLVFVFIFISFLACKDEDKIVVDFGGPGDIAGSFVTADITVPVINGDDIPNATFELTVKAPSNNVAQFDMNVRRISPDNMTTDYAHLLTVTEFPSNIVITTVQLAEALGITVADLNLGDSFEFLNTSISSEDGSVATFESLGPELLTQPGQKQAYKLLAQIICPIPDDYAVGMYLLEVLSAESGMLTFNTQEVEVKPSVINGDNSIFQREFEAVYLEELDIGNSAMAFQFVYFCGTRNAAENQSTGLSCASPILIQPATTGIPYSSNFDDDDEIIINFIEALNSCGGDFATQIKLTKIN